MLWKKNPYNIHFQQILCNYKLGINFVQKGLARIITSNGLSRPSKEIEKSSDGLFSWT